ncbi:MAG: hypothetical protein SF097_11125 [Acidobacteriota bacterium]|nr:hypothetical protein [Acidobacteriota bacterium]
MILSVKGQFQNGVVIPTTKIEGRNGQQVIVTFLEDSDMEMLQETLPITEKVIPVNGDLLDDSTDELGYDPLMKLIAEFAMDTGIGDLAHEHDHYLYGTPKRGDYGK